MTEFKVSPRRPRHREHQLAQPPHRRPVRQRPRLKGRPKSYPRRCRKNSSRSMRIRRSTVAPDLSHRKCCWGLNAQWPGCGMSTKPRRIRRSSCMRSSLRGSSMPQATPTCLPSRTPSPPARQLALAPATRNLVGRPKGCYRWSMRSTPFSGAGSFARSATKSMRSPTWTFGANSYKPRLKRSNRWNCSGMKLDGRWHWKWGMAGLLMNWPKRSWATRPACSKPWPETLLRLPSSSPSRRDTRLRGSRCSPPGTRIPETPRNTQGRDDSQVWLGTARGLSGFLGGTRPIQEKKDWPSRQGEWRHIAMGLAQCLWWHWLRSSCRQEFGTADSTTSSLRLLGDRCRLREPFGHSLRPSAERGLSNWEPGRAEPILGRYRSTTHLHRPADSWTSMHGEIQRTPQGSMAQKARSSKSLQIGRRRWSRNCIPDLSKDSWRMCFHTGRATLPISRTSWTWRPSSSMLPSSREWAVSECGGRTFPGPMTPSRQCWVRTPPGRSTTDPGRWNQNRSLLKSTYLLAGRALNVGPKARCYLASPHLRPLLKDAKRRRARKGRCPPLNTTDGWAMDGHMPLGTTTKTTCWSTRSTACWHKRSASPPSSGLHSRLWWKVEAQVDCQQLACGSCTTTHLAAASPATEDRSRWCAEPLGVQPVWRPWSHTPAVERARAPRWTWHTTWGAKQGTRVRDRHDDTLGSCMLPPGPQNGIHLLGTRPAGHFSTTGEMPRGPWHSPSQGVSWCTLPQTDQGARDLGLVGRP